MGPIALIVIILLVLFVIGPLLKIAAGLTFALIIPILFAMLAGMFAGRLIRGRGYGPFGDVLLGLAGWFVGAIVLGMLGVGASGGLVGILVSIVGAVILVGLVRLLGDKDFAR
jgi:uncharacterized membrane protein YeaQ/YmgE (transglycosylase-associated protein family)